MPAGSSQLGEADAALLRGCYDCLLEARASYRRLAAGVGGAPLQLRVLEADLLIAVREKELGLLPSGVLAEARRIAAALPGLEAERGVAVVDAIPDSGLGVPERALQNPRAQLAGARKWLSRGPLREPVRVYLQSALDCAYEAGNGGAVRLAAGAPAPLLRYRAAICGADSIDALAAVRASEPRFVETSLFIARTEIGRLVLDGPRQARFHVAEVLTHFPGSAVATYLAASYAQVIGDHAEALRFHDRTLALRPGHGPALLGRVISLTHLERAENAIDAAARLVERGGDLVANAYYWRAHNWHALGRLAEARVDVDAAKQLLGSEDLLVLAGVIEYEQGDLDVARGDLAIVVGANQRRCEAHWYLGLVDRQRKRWSSARQALERAMVCYRERARTTTDQRRQLQARADVDAAYRARASAALDAAIAADMRQQHRAALAAATSAVADKDLAAARALVDAAGDDPELADAVRSLRTYLDASTRGAR